MRRPATRRKPTPRALDVLRFVRWHVRAHGQAPTRRDIGDALGMSGPTAHQHLQALEQCRLVRLSTAWRGIELL